MNYKQAALAFAINSALFEPAISVRKHRSLNTTKHPLKGPSARGCKALFLIATPSAARGLRPQSPPPPSPPAVRSRLGSRSAREGHNSCSIGGGARLPPLGSREGRERTVGEGSSGRQWRPRPRPLLLPRRTCSGKRHVCSGRTPPLQTEASSRERRAGSVGSSPRSRGGCSLAPSRRALLDRGRPQQRAFREQRRHSSQTPLSMGFPRQEYWSGLPFPPPGRFLLLRSKSGPAGIRPETASGGDAGTQAEGNGGRDLPPRALPRQARG
ncbi:uncharacterized protein [Bos mutus]|uniref:uncharacterized protein n=1 Tax=Bos mutus TaxID=72004 RepID=UPI0038B607AF